MRTKDKIRTIRAASDGQGHIEIKRTEVLDGAEYRIDNWRQVSRALGLIIKDQLMLASADESAEQYISEMIATRGDTADGTLLLQRDSFTQFTNYVDAYTSELPFIIKLLERIIPDSPGTDASREEFEFAVEVNISGTQSIDDTRQKLTVVLDLFGKFLTLDQQVRIKGFDTGSDWLVFDAVNEFQAEYIGWVVSCAGDVIREIAEKPKDYLRLMAKVIGKKSGQDAAATDSFISDVVDEFIGELRDQKIAEAMSHLKERYVDDQAKQRSLNEGQVKARKAVESVTALHSNGVQIQIPEKIAININIKVTGDNNVVQLPQIPQIALPLENEESSDEEISEPEDGAIDR